MMTRILDYDALFNERGEQANICTDAGLGGSYAGRVVRQMPEDLILRAPERSPEPPRPICGEPLPRESTRESTRTMAIRDYDPTLRRRPVRYVDFDTFERPERTCAEAKAGMEKTALLFGSIITAIVAIAILL